MKADDVGLDRDDQETFDDRFRELIAPSNSDFEVAKRMLEEGVIGAADTIVELASDEDVPARIRLDASKFILERCMPVETHGPTWDDLFARLDASGKEPARKRARKPAVQDDDE
jgi:hypothetical protein